MKHVCIIINKVFNILGLQPRDKATRLENNTIHKNENRVEFPEERNAFVFIIQHGRRVVSCIKTTMGLSGNLAYSKNITLVY